MTPLFTEMAERAGIDARHVEKYADEEFTAHLQEFAELIVKECARVDSENNNPDHIDGESFNHSILDHFGVTP